MRYAIRRTQKDRKAPYSVIKAPKSVADMDRSELQALAKERDIDARQSTEALREALS